VVRTKLMLQKSAFTMIELIFAIVIIGISVISLPMMIQATSKGIENSIVQEAVFAAAAELNQAVTYHWDENSMEVNATDLLARVIEITPNDCEHNASSPNYRRRLGHITQDKHRRCLESSATGAANNNINDTVDALEDANGTTTIYINNAGGTTEFDSAGYKQDYNATITVEPNAIFNGVANANMKKITVYITNETNPITNPITKLVTYSANIGEIDYSKRSYE
jgi:prepilin-type N-terminal cleavage/methylation domain-containing protein